MLQKTGLNGAVFLCLIVNDKVVNINGKVGIFGNIALNSTGQLAVGDGSIKFVPPVCVYLQRIKRNLLSRNPIIGHSLDQDECFTGCDGGKIIGGGRRSVKRSVPKNHACIQIGRSFHGANGENGAGRAGRLQRTDMIIGSREVSCDRGALFVVQGISSRKLHAGSRGVFL